MFDSILLYLAKQLAAYAIGRLAKYMGVDDAAKHVQDVLEKYTPLAPDPNPSPASLRNPKADWLK